MSIYDLNLIKELNAKAEEYKSINNYKEEAHTYNRITDIYSKYRDYKNAITYALKSLAINENPLKSENAISMISYNLGVFYNETNDFAKAEQYFTKAVKYRKSQPQQTGVFINLVNIAMVQKQQGKYEQAIKTMLDAYEYSKENEEDLRLCYGTLAELYEKTGNSAKQQEFFQRYKELSQSIEKNIDIQRQFAEMNAANAKAESLLKDVVLKDKELEIRRKKDSLQQSKLKSDSLRNRLIIEQKERKIQEQNERIKQEKTQRIILIISFAIAFLAVVSLLLFIGYRNKRASNISLSEKNAEIMQQREEIIQQRDNLEDAYHKIENQNKAIKAGISYAALIQEAMLNKGTQLKDYVDDSFIIFKPRDIVSGDFYWYSKIEKNIVVAAIDCTGHGVPGAFLSMIGNDLLNDIVVRDKITSPEEIITQLNKGIKQALNQEYTDNLDGMDIAVCTINKENKKLYFSGAMNPVIIINKEQVINQKGDMFSVGGLEFAKKKKTFNLSTFDIKEGTWFYIFSDGIADQTSGKNAKEKFGITRLKDLLQKNHNKSGAEQKQLLIEALENWQGKTSQVDDIILIGVKAL